MILRDKLSHTIYLNTAEVPRIKAIPDVPEANEEQHHFVVATFENRKLVGVERVWVGVHKGTKTCRMVQQHSLMRKGADGHLEFWNDFTEQWDAGLPGDAPKQGAEALQKAALSHGTNGRSRSR